MKFKLSMFLLAANLQAQDFTVQPYQNQIISIQQMQGLSQQAIMIQFKNENPVASYTPANFAQSQSGTMRYFMPNTTLEETITSDLVDVVGSGVEIVLEGTLISKIVTDRHVVFLIKK